jgi:hypothetical protein
MNALRAVVFDLDKRGEIQNTMYQVMFDESHSARRNDLLNQKINLVCNTLKCEVPVFNAVEFPNVYNNSYNAFAISDSVAIGPGFGDAPTSAITFVMLHEIGHVVLGHTKNIGRISHSAQFKNEVAADAYATRQMAKAGYSTTEILGALYAAVTALPDDVCHNAAFKAKWGITAEDLDECVKILNIGLNTELDHPGISARFAYIYKEAENAKSNNY